MKDKKTRKLLLKGNLREGLYEFENPKIPRRDTLSAFVAHSTGTSTRNLCHVHLGHPSDRVLSQILNDCNINVSDNRRMFCESCQLGKNSALPFKLSVSHADHPLALIHTDVWGPAPISSMSGFKFISSF